MSAADVSVVIPTRNRRELLKVTLAHVLAQRDVAVEVIVVDDGSDDGTGASIRSMGHPNVKVLSAQGNGVSAARNVGLEAASARWVAFNDDDDLWAPDKLATQLAVLRGDPTSQWVCSGAVRVNDDLEVISAERVWTSGDVATMALVANPVPGGASGVVAEAELVASVDGFDERLQVLADWDLWIRLALRSPMSAVDRPLHAYRIHTGGMSGVPAVARAELAVLEAKYAADRAERGVAIARPRLECWMADRAQRAGDRAGAAGAFLRGAPVLGRARSIARAAEAAVWPEAHRRRDRRRGGRVNAAWMEEVGGWLPSR